jgi:hypothetical protein
VVIGVNPWRFSLLFPSEWSTILIMQRLAGVSAIAVVFGFATAYLCAAGALMLASPDTLQMRLDTLLLLGLLFAGPYIFLMAGIVAGMIGWGLWRLNNWARRATMVVAAVGIVMLVPGVSSPALGWTFAVSGFGMIVRVMVLWYLWRDDVAQAFQRQPENRL